VALQLSASISDHPELQYIYLCGKHSSHSYFYLTFVKGNDISDAEKVIKETTKERQQVILHTEIDPL